MKRLFATRIPLAAAIALLLNSFSASAQELYFTKEQMPDMLKCLPAPPDSGSSAFDYDVLRYMWGKKMRQDKQRADLAIRDATWSLDTLAAILSTPFGHPINAEDTPQIFKLLVDGISTIEQVRLEPKAHYSRKRPYVYFNEHSLTVWEETELSGEGSYPSGHTIRAWSAALLLTEVNPAATEALFERAYIAGESRVIAGAHWQSDVDASRLAASIAYARLQSSEAFRSQVRKARSEFRGLSHRSRP